MKPRNIATTIQQYLNQDINEDINVNVKSKKIVEFLKDKKFKNSKSKMFIYHGTSIPPDSFELKDDYDYEDSNIWSGDLPEDYLFLTTDIDEALAYGQFVIPCELKEYNSKSFGVDSYNPSRVFDKDYGIDLYKPDEYVGFWDKFQDSYKRVLIIKGYDRKWTVITDVDNVIPRTDLASEFYNI